MVGAASTDFLSVDARQYLEFSNENTTLICQIESVEGVENIAEIAQTTGVDVLWVGHFDLSTSLGIPAQFHHDKFLDALDQVVRAANRYGLGAAIQPGNLDQAREWIELGFNVISFGADFRVYLEALTRSLRDVRQLAESRR
jgi:2-dehydro-3-deoxyglucarate aldolase/4-hydroxy-2-oxoheptanedioate aldolase